MSQALVKQTILYSVGEIIPKIIAFILLPVYTHYLSPSDYGVLSYTNTVVTFLFVFISLALNSFVLRHYFELHNEIDKKKLLGNIFLFVGFVNICLLGLAFLFLPRLLNYYNIQVPWNPYFKLALLINFFEVFSIIPLVMYRVKQQATYFLALSLSRVLLQCALTYYFVVVSRQGLIGSYYAQLLPLILYFFIYWFLIIKNVSLNISVDQIKKGLKFSLPLLPGALSYIALSLSDRFILERWVSVSEIGIYNVAYVLSQSLNVVIQSGYKAIEPEIFKRYNTPDFDFFIKQAKSYFLFIVYTGAMFLTLFSQEAFYFLTSDDFHKGYLLVPPIMIGVLMTAQNVIFGGVLSAEKNTKVIGTASALGAAVSILFNLIFVPKWGTFAAAAASALSFCCMNIILFSKMKQNEKSFRPEAIALATFSVVTFSIFYGLKVNVSSSTFTLKSAFVILYLFLIFKIYGLQTKPIGSFLKT